MTTINIAPAFSDQAGQCRIYRHDGNPDDARASYRFQPDEWREVGVMNSRGKLVCFEGTNEQHQDLVNTQPLIARLCFSYQD